MISVFNPVSFASENIIQTLTNLPDVSITFDHSEPENCRLFFQTNAEVEDENFCKYLHHMIIAHNPQYFMIVMHVECEETSHRIKHGVSLINAK